MPSGPTPEACRPAGLHWLFPAPAVLFPQEAGPLPHLLQRLFLGLLGGPMTTHTESHPAPTLLHPLGRAFSDVPSHRLLLARRPDTVTGVGPRAGGRPSLHRGRRQVSGGFLHHDFKACPHFPRESGDGFHHLSCSDVDSVTQGPLAGLIYVESTPKPLSPTPLPEQTAGSLDCIQSLQVIEGVSTSIWELTLSERVARGPDSPQPRPPGPDVSFRFSLVCLAFAMLFFPQLFK